MMPVAVPGPSLLAQVLRGMLILLVLVMCLDIAMNWWSDFVTASIENHLLASGATAPEGCAELLQGDGRSASLLARTRWAISEWMGWKHPCLDHAKAVHKQSLGPMAALSEVRWREGVENAIVGVLFGWLAPASRAIGTAFYAVWGELPWVARFPILFAFFFFLLFRNKSVEVVGKLPFMHIGARVANEPSARPLDPSIQMPAPPLSSQSTPSHQRAPSRTQQMLGAEHRVAGRLEFKPGQQQDQDDTRADAEDAENSEPDAQPPPLEPPDVPEPKPHPQPAPQPHACAGSGEQDIRVKEETQGPEDMTVASSVKREETQSED